MAILNTTQDSFSDGGDFFNQEKALNYAYNIIDNQLADIIDIGGESSRPGAVPVSIDEEIRRTIPIIENIRKYSDSVSISIDTVKYEVARLATEAGANIINDISGLTSDIKMGELAAKNNLSYIIMHKKGEPKNMQDKPTYNDVVEEVYNFLDRQIQLAKSMGIDKVYSDVGIGFGKNYQHNIELLRHLSEFNKLNVPMVLGLSRKRFISTMLGIENPKERDMATLLIHTILLKENIEIIRVHKLEEYKILKKIYQEIG